MYYPNDEDERKIIGNLTSYFRKLVKDGVLQKSNCSGLGFDAKILFFGTTKQYTWRINKKRAKLELDILLTK